MTPEQRRRVETIWNEPRIVLDMNANTITLDGVVLQAKDYEDAREAFDVLNGMKEDRNAWFNWKERVLAWAETMP
jgi:hypothetical protein